MLPILLMACGSAPPLPDLVASDPSVSAPSDTVVVVIACTTRADRLGPWGADRPTSPYLDRLAATGTRFVRTLGSASWTRPAVAALLTGQHPYRLGIDPEQTDGSFADGLAPAALTLAERFSQAGFATVGVTANPNVNSRLGMAQGFDVYVDTSSWEGSRDKQTGPDMVNRWLSLAQKADGPLYGQIVLVDTHNPLSAERRRRLRLGLSPVFGGSLLDRYDASLTRVDDALIALDRGLSALGHGNRLLVVIGDHGEGLFRPHHAGRGHSHYLYDANLRVPWVVHGPGVAAGHQVRGLSSSVDLAPTLAELAGLPQAPTDGVSHAAAVHGDTDQTGVESVVSMTRYGPVDRARLTTRDWVLIENRVDGGHPSRGPAELYSAADRSQQRDLSTTRAGTLARLSEDLDHRIATWESNSLLGQGEHWQGQLSDDTRGQLRALGYTEE